MKRILSYTKKEIKTLGFILANFIMVILPVKCEDLFDKGIAASGNVKTKLVAITEAVFPVLFIADLLVLIFDHNEKRLHVAKIGMFVMIGAYVLIEFVGTGTILKDTLQGIFNF